MNDGIYNAQIRSVDIVFEPDRSFWQTMITVDHGFGTQALCGVIMDPAMVGEMACSIMDALGSNSFFGLTGAHCRIEIRDQFIVGIGHWRLESWFHKDDLQKP